MSSQAQAPIPIPIPKSLSKTVTEKPHLFAVTFHNDDYTPMDFVVSLLIRVFRKDEKTANTIMKEVHDKGSGVAGVYSFDIAVTKKLHADRLSAEKSYPLLITISEEA